MNQAKSVKVSIFGDQYSFLSDEPEERVIQAAQKVNLLMHEIASKVSHSDAKKIAILVAVQIMSQKLVLESLLGSDQQKLKQLIEMIDREIK